jgi:hypothetical protein
MHQNEQCKTNTQLCICILPEVRTNGVWHFSHGLYITSISERLVFGLWNDNLRHLKILQEASLKATCCQYTL